MTFRLVLTKKDPRCTDFVLVGDHSHVNASARVAANPPVYTSDTTYYNHPRNGSRATTTITRTDPTGDRFQVGVIEWLAHPRDRAQLVVGTRNVQMARSGIYTSPERFTAADGYVYEWQIQDGRPQLVPLRAYNHASTAYVATFVQSQSGFFFRRKNTSSLFVPPEGLHIVDDIVVTFIYYESKWREKEIGRSRSSLSGPI